MADVKELVDHYFAEHPRSKLKMGLVRTHLRGRLFEFLTASGVFSKRRLDAGTRVLIESMILPKKGIVLDLGCGYGAVGIAAAIFNPNIQVFMTDINERAVWLATENAKRNAAYNVHVKRGFLYEPVEDMRFNVVLSNPPVSAGMKTITSIVAGAPNHLKGRGTLQVVVRSKIAGKKLVNIIQETFGNAKILARKSGYRVLIAEKQ